MPPDPATAVRDDPAEELDPDRRADRIDY
jgi:hypothetical protein